MRERSSILNEALRILLPLILLGAGVLGFMFLLSMRAQSTEQAPAQLPPLVSTAVLTPHTGVLDIDLGGEVSPFREVVLATEVAGKVILKTELCEAGVYVEAGELLCEIDSSDYLLEIEKLKIELQQAADLITELARETENAQKLQPIVARDVELQQGEVRRLERLGNVVSPSDVDTARRGLVAAENSYQTMLNQISLLTARSLRLESARRLVQKRLEQAQLDLDRCRITAPISGVVVEENVEENTYVQKGASMVAIDDTSAVEVKVRLRMEELNWVLKQEGRRPERKSGQSYQLPQTPATISMVLDGVTYTWQGVLTRFDGIGLDKQNRTIPCVVLVSQPTAVQSDVDREFNHGPSALVRGMYVNVALHTRPQTTLLRAPQVAVKPNGKVQLLENGEVHFRSVNVAGRDGDYLLLEPTDGLKAGDKVIVTPLSNVHDGLVVREAL
ncbi:efflux RND transporter periplasmic adaptor subunit [Lignipirellula cremea]|uniref:Multidrug resistance protein MdtE n=1 Tax=Lignipirellula cremea TaxID=2528010 RepID=A0A518DZ17_9BACT|nr:HlyD family efflux transporter periplasmic adaptor subunit [Lignipirellula cremea]QDU97055.1 Multidrug resistance protein MdtE precursor [Lignipirellula cremea]